MLSATRLASLARFAAGGVLSSATVLGVSALLREGGFTGERVAAAIGLASSLVVNFAVMRHFVFRAHQQPLVRQGVGFLATSAAFRGLEYLAFLIANTVFRLHYLVALLLVLAISFGLKFLVYEGWIFRRNCAADDSSPPRGS